MNKIVVGTETVYESNDKEKTEDIYDICCNLAMSGLSTYSDEPIKWFIDNEIYVEYEY